MSLNHEIFPGAWLLPGAISLLDQKRMIHIFKNMKEDLYVPKTKYGKMNLKMNCLGRHWNAIDYKYYKTRNDVDNKEVKEINPFLISIAHKYSKELFPYHNPSWDICICNYYDTRSALGMHRDNSESEMALYLGHPVVSFSVGASCIFRVGGLTRNSEYKDIILESGDIFIFGGESRLRFHGIMEILNDGKFMKSLNNGRINFTLRKY